MAHGCDYRVLDLDGGVWLGGLLFSNYCGVIMTDQQKYIDELESAIATLDLENQLMRARNERLEKEVEHLRDILTMKAKTQSS